MACMPDQATTWPQGKKESSHGSGDISELGIDRAMYSTVLYQKGAHFHVT